jgi:polyisoprenoid-binding protein YceI
MVWEFDPAHTSAQFAVRHLGIMTVRGHMNLVRGQLETEGEMPTKAEVALDPKSIDTREPNRDTHLRSPDFLLVDQHPEIVFKSTGISGRRDSLKIVGELTIRGITKPVELTGEMTPVISDHRGLPRFGVSVETTIDRKEFGMEWNHLVDNALMVGDQVKISVEGEVFQPQ